MTVGISLLGSGAEDGAFGDNSSTIFGASVASVPRIELDRAEPEIFYSLAKILCNKARGAVDNCHLTLHILKYFDLVSSLIVLTSRSAKFEGCWCSTSRRAWLGPTLPCLPIGLFAMSPVCMPVVSRDPKPLFVRRFVSYFSPGGQIGLGGASESVTLDMTPH